jgi:hypothetical protein
VLALLRSDDDVRRTSSGGVEEANGDASAAAGVVVIDAAAAVVVAVPVPAAVTLTRKDGGDEEGMAEAPAARPPDSVGASRGPPSPTSADNLRTTGATASIACSWSSWRLSGLGGARRNRRNIRRMFEGLGRDEETTARQLDSGLPQRHVHRETKAGALTMHKWLSLFGSWGAKAGAGKRSASRRSPVEAGRRRRGAGGRRTQRRLLFGIRHLSLPHPNARHSTTNHMSSQYP